MKLLVRFFIITIFMFFVSNNYAQFNDSWGGGSTGAAKQDVLTPVDDNSGSATHQTFGSSNSSTTNTPPDMATFGVGPPPPPGGPSGQQDGTVPIDGGITLLLAAGIGKGLKSYKRKQKQTANFIK